MQPRSQKLLFWTLLGASAIGLGAWWWADTLLLFKDLDEKGALGELPIESPKRAYNEFREDTTSSIRQFREQIREIMGQAKIATTTEDAQ